MIAEIIPAAYDAEGKRVFRPFDRRKGPHPTFPMGRYVSQPLTVKCSSMEDVRRFLNGCKRVSDKEQFGKDDYWQPPEDFEKPSEATVTTSPYGRGVSYSPWVTTHASSVEAPVAMARGMPGSSIFKMAVVTLSNLNCVLLAKDCRDSAR
jgi:hypothetical protein